jgi:hypothetical protein
MKDDIYKIIRAILTLTLVTFIILKLTHIVSLSWWWVLAPAWASLAIAVIIAVFVILYKVIKRCFEK